MSLKLYDPQLYFNKTIYRIKEIKKELNKLEGSNYRFPNNGLKDFALMPHDIELIDIPEKAEVPEDVKTLIQESKQKVIEEMERKGKVIGHLFIRLVTIRKKSNTI